MVFEIAGVADVVDYHHFCNNGMCVELDKDTQF